MSLRCYACGESLEGYSDDDIVVCDGRVWCIECFEGSCGLGIDRMVLGYQNDRSMVL